jgi:dolichol-phosphate mannosyltransferase
MPRAPAAGDGTGWECGHLDQSKGPAVSGALNFHVYEREEIAINYSLNNVLTYRDKRRRGWRWMVGLASFMAICSIGAIANVGVAAYLFERQSEWFFAAIAGVLTGVVWNYAVSSTYTWGRPKMS